MKRYKRPFPLLGSSVPPWSRAGHLYAQAGAGFVKLDKEPENRSANPMTREACRSAFSSPTLATLRGVDQVIVQTRTDLTGVEPEKGQALGKTDQGLPWNEHPHPDHFREFSIHQLLWGKKPPLLTSPKVPTILDQSKMENKQEGYMSGPIVIGDYCYIHSENNA